MKIFGKTISFQRFLYLCLDYLVEFFVVMLMYVTLPLIKLLPKAPTKKILVISHRALMAEYLAEVTDLYKNNADVQFYLLDYFWYDRADSKSFISSKLPFKKISRIRAAFIKWDLMIASSFLQPHFMTNLRCPTLFIEHGSDAGGLRDGGLYVFGKGMYRPYTKQIRFTKMFMASEYNKNRAIAVDSQLKDVVKVVGFIRQDKLLAKNKERSAIREKLGFKPNENVVFVLSSWGKDCLFHIMGDKFLLHARKCLKDYRIILNVHPMEYRAKPKGERVWGEYLEHQKQYGFCVRSPSEDWSDFMIASDVVVADFTSLSLSAVILGKPIVFTPIADNVLAADSLIWKIKEFSPELKPDASNLSGSLECALHQYPKDQQMEIRTLINSQLFHAKELYKKEIDDILYSGR